MHPEIEHVQIFRPQVKLIVLWQRSGRSNQADGRQGFLVRIGGLSLLLRVGTGGIQLTAGEKTRSGNQFFALAPTCSANALKTSTVTP